MVIYVLMFVLVFFQVILFDLINKFKKEFRDKYPDREKVAQMLDVLKYQMACDFVKHSYFDSKFKYFSEEARNEIFKITHNVKMSADTRDAYLQKVLDEMQKNVSDPGEN